MISFHLDPALESRSRPMDRLTDGSRERPKRWPRERSGQGSTRLDANQREDQRTMATQASTSTSEEQARQTLNRYEESVNFLSGLFNSDNARGRDLEQPQRPHVTLTFAQTIDGYIAGKKGRQLRLSGDESMAMTH